MLYHRGVIDISYYKAVSCLICAAQKLGSICLFFAECVRACVYTCVSNSLCYLGFSFLVMSLLSPSFVLCHSNQFQPSTGSHWG